MQSHFCIKHFKVSHIQMLMTSELMHKSASFNNIQIHTGLVQQS